VATLRDDARKRDRRSRQFRQRRLRRLGFSGVVLARFVVAAKAWAHFDIYAWNPKPRAHAPQGGDVQAARAVFALLEARYRR